MSTETGSATGTGESTEGSWDLSDLIDLESAGLEAAADPNDDRGAVDALLTEADRLSAEFATELEGKVGEIDGPGLVDAMQRLARISDLAGRALNYAHLRFAADTEDPANGALLQRASEQATQIQTRLVFFELEWVAIDDDRAEELLATEGLDFCAHHLRMERRYRPHLLTAPEERIVTETRADRRRCMEPPLRRAHLGDPGRAARGRRARRPRRRALRPLRSRPREAPDGRRGRHRALEPGLRTRAYVFNTLLQDKATTTACATTPTGSRRATSPTRPPTSRCRRWSRPSAAATTSPRRWYRLEGQAARPRTTRRLRPHGGRGRATTRRSNGRRHAEIVLDAYESASPRAGRDRRAASSTSSWIDAPPRPAKRGGAFCAYTVPSRTPLRDAQLDRSPARRDDARPRARPRHPRSSSPPLRGSSTRTRR